MISFKLLKARQFAEATSRLMTVMSPEETRQIHQELQGSKSDLSRLNNLKYLAKNSRDQADAAVHRGHFEDALRLNELSAEAYRVMGQPERGENAYRNQIGLLRWKARRCRDEGNIDESNEHLAHALMILDSISSKDDPPEKKNQNLSLKAGILIDAKRQSEALAVIDSVLMQEDLDHGRQKSLEELKDKAMSLDESDEGKLVEYRGGGVEVEVITGPRPETSRARPEGDSKPSAKPAAKAEEPIRPELSEKTIKKEISRYRNEDPPKAAQLYEYLSALLEQRGDIKAADEAITEAMVIYFRIRPGKAKRLERQRERLWEKAGIDGVFVGTFDRYWPLAQKLLKAGLIKKSADYLMLDARQFSKAGIHGAAASQAFKALLIYRHLKDARQTSISLNFIANELMEEGKYEQAEAMALEAIKSYKKAGMSTASLYERYGEILSKMGKVDAALKAYQTAMDGSDNKQVIRRLEIIIINLERRKAMRLEGIDDTEVERELDGYLNEKRILNVVRGFCLVAERLKSEGKYGLAATVTSNLINIMETPGITGFYSSGSRTKESLIGGQHEFHGEVLVKAGKIEEAREAYQKAFDVFKTSNPRRSKRITKYIDRLKAKEMEKAD